LKETSSSKSIFIVSEKLLPSTVITAVSDELHLFKAISEAA